VLAAFNLGSEPVSFDWPASSQARDLAGHGLPGAANGGRVSLPPHGAWFGTAA
jgi:alpha-glucosidase